MRRNSTVYSHRPRKRFGQNFLIDESIIDEIINAADISVTDCVLEIGPGRGALTERLSELAGKLVAIEIDRDLYTILSERFADKDNVNIIQGDIMKVDIDELFPDSERIKIVANLPYNITTPVLMKLLESSKKITSMVVMVQREVALRMCAEADSPNYGALSLAVAFYSKPRIVAEVPATSFRPIPKVESAVVKLEIQEPPLKGEEKDRLFSFIKAAFSQRRKTLANALAGAGIMEKQDAEELIASLGWDKNIRGEKLRLTDFIRISQDKTDENLKTK